MKNKLLSQLYESCKKWKTLVLLGAMLLIGINTAWADNIPAGTTIYVDVTNFSGEYTYGYYLSVVHSDNKSKRLDKYDTSGASNSGGYVPNKDTWTYKTLTRVGSTNIYYTTITSAVSDAKLSLWSKDCSGYNDCWTIDVAGNIAYESGKNLIEIVSGYTKNDSRNTCCFSATWGTYNTTYSVSYNGNGNSGGSAPTDATEYDSGDAVTVAGNTGNMTKSGYVFAGWNTAANGSGTYYAPGATFSITAATTLYAMWVDNNVLSGTNVMFYIQGYCCNNYLINGLKGGDVSAVTTSDNIISSGAYSYVNTATSNLTAHYYISNNKGGWEGKPNTGIQSASGGELFWANEGTGSTPAKTAETDDPDVDGDELSLSTTCNSTTGVYNGRQLYVLYYLVEASNFINVTYSASTVLAIPISAASTPHASTCDISDLSEGEYTLKTILTDGIIYYIADVDEFEVAAATSFTVAYDANGGTGTMTDSNSPYSSGATVTVKTNTFTRSGYSFTGWNTDSGGGGTAYSAGNTFSISANTTLYAQWSETKSIVSLVASPAGVGTFSSGGGTVTSVQAGVDTKPSVTANAVPGYLFSSWGITGGADISSTSANPTTVTGKGAGAAATLTATFNRTYAYLQGRLTVYNAARNSETHTADSKGGWDENSTRIAMDYDETNHYFYRHTYKTPAELKAKISNNDQWFSIARSNASGSWSGKTTYHPSANTDLTTAGIGQKKAAQTSTTTYNYKFNSSATDGYVILYFDEAGVWYTLEHQVTYNGNGNTGGTVPTDNTYYANGTSVTVASAPVGWAKEGYSFGGWNKANDGSGSNYTAGSGSFTISTNTPLYAKWTQTITLDANTTYHGSGANTTTSSVTLNATALSTFSGTSAAAGYQVEGYYTAATGGDKVLTKTGAFASSSVEGYITGGKWTHAGATTLYAHMEPATYSVTLDKNGGSKNGSAKVTYLSNKLTSISEPSKSGYSVLAYYKEPGMTNLVADAGGNLQANVTNYTDESGNWISTSGQTLYAKWGLQVPASLYIDGQATGGWDNKHQMTKNSRTFTYTSYDLPAGTYEFCFKNSGGSDYLKPTTANPPCSSTKNHGNITWSDSGDSNHNFKFTTSGIGDVTFTVEFRESDVLVSVDYTAASGSSSWYLIGDRYGTWDAASATYRFNRSWRGMSGIYYRIENVDNNDKYFKLSTKSDRYGPSGSNQTVALNSKYTAIKNTSESVGNKAYSGNVGWVWCVVDPRNLSSVQFWVESKTYYTLSKSSDHGTVTTKDDTYDLAATQYESGETIKISVTADDGYWIDDITIGETSVQTDVNASSWNGTTTMPASDATLTVTYNRIYTLNYDIGSVSGTDGNISSSPTTATGSTVIGGRVITLTAPTEKTGYSWKGWYLNNDGSGVQQCSTKAYAITISGNTSVYACYTINNHSITHSAATNGSYTIKVGSEDAVSDDTDADYGTTITLAASPSAGYYCSSWTVTKAGGGTVTVSSNQFTMPDDDVTVEATFSARYALRGSKTNEAAGGMPGWSVTTSNMDVVASTSTITLPLEPNTDYKYRIYDNKPTAGMHGQQNETSQSLDTEWTLDGGNDVYFTTQGYGDYTFSVREGTDPAVTISGPTSCQLTLGRKVYYNDNEGTLENATNTNGGTVIGHTNENTTGFDINDAGYFASGSNITFTATPATGYRVVGWYNNADCAANHEYEEGDYVTIDGNTLTLKNLTSATTVYVKYAEKMTTVTIAANDEEGGDITVGGADHTWGTTTKVGVHTTKTLVVSAKEGFYFSEWTRSADPDFHLSGYGESNTTVTLTGDGAGETSGQTLTANFQPLDKIYFRNENSATGNKLWNDAADANVYVFFDAYWDKDGKGAGGNGKAHATMTQITGTYIYWAYVPRDVTTAGYTKVAFSSRGWITDNNFYGGGFGAYRGDYNRALNMYVPARKESANLNSGVSYNNNGYWMKYDTKARQGAGYYLKKYDGRNSYSLDKQFIANTDNATSIQVTIRVDNTDASNTKYMITSAGGLNYLAKTTPSASSYSDINLNEDNRSLSDNDVYFQLSASSEGDYTFIIDQTRDTMRLTVDYPVSVGDYRLKNSYNDGTAKNTYSDVIKSNGASTPRTLSMYLNTDGSGTLVLQKCTLITAGVPQWDAGDATNLGGVLTTVGSNPGVYQFDVAVSEDKVSSAPTATKYTGPYYIKTDGTTGGWANYKENYMSENTINYDTENPDKSFNYYYCKYYSSAGTNLKCVIANDYCNALTDTLKGDAVIGEGSQTTPSAANVRFSYNNYTNEIKRAYLGSSTNSNFLCVKGNTTASTPHIYDKDEASPGDATAAASIKFEDKQNWVYEIIVKADANARAKLTAVFNGNTQYFWGHAGESGQEWDNVNTVQLFGGSSGTYGLTLVYDFKTNKLINAWTPIGDAVNADLELNSDVLLLREHQEAPKTITFGKKDETNYASLTEVKTAYCVLRFNRWKLSNRANPTDINSEHCKHTDSIAKYHGPLDPEDANYLPIHERELYFISFPYDVKMSDIISFGTYYDTWGIMYYDGKGRAKNGYWIDSEPNWKYFTPEEYATKTLNAYEGYLIGIDLATMRYDNTSFWTNNSSEADIYFPSNTAVSSITRKEVTVEIDTVGYQCTINRPYGSDGDRRIKDSHWHCIGVPAYANITHDINNGEAADETWENKELLYLYEWDTSTNDHHIKEASTFDFQAMYAYLVQYAGKTLTWAAAATGPSSIVAKRMRTEELRDRQFDLQLLQGNKKADHTYIRLSDDEEVTTGFEFNHDVSKMMLSGANIYTLIGKEQTAANSLPLNLEQTTVVPVGVKIAATGDYTFAIPEGTEGIGVVLVDNETGTRTNLSLTDYTINLGTGTHNERFVLEISPIIHTPTGIENTNAGVQNGIRKVMVDGILYIVRDGKIFDAQGKRVK